MSAQEHTEASVATLSSTDDQSASKDREIRVAKYAVLFALIPGAALALCVALAVLTQGFANVSNQGHLNLMGWCLLASMAPGLIVPVKAKSSLIWVLYFLLFVVVAYMIRA